MMLENGAPYKLYHKYDISHIAKRLSELDESIWKLDVHRQAEGHGPHYITNSLILNYCRGEPEFDRQKALQNRINHGLDRNYGDEGNRPNHIKPWNHRTESDFLIDVNNIEKKIIDEELNSYTDKIVNHLEEQFNGIAGLVLYVNLPAGGNITPHTDGGYYLSIVHRLHIPIITNPDVFFLVKDTKFHMEEGYVYELNNQQSHGVKNLGDNQRIHLIVDIIPKDKIPSKK